MLLPSFSISCKNMQLFKQIKPEFIDERGEITMILDNERTPIKSVLLITCKKGAIRANHYHKEDSHYAYMLSGSVEYFEEPVSGTEKKRETAMLSEGDMVYTPAMTVHAMCFLEDSVFIALATKSRKEGAYEDDTVRIKLI